MQPPGWPTRKGPSIHNPRHVNVCTPQSLTIRGLPACKNVLVNIGPSADSAAWNLASTRVNTARRCALQLRGISELETEELPAGSKDLGTEGLGLGLVRVQEPRTAADQQLSEVLGALRILPLH